MRRGPGVVEITRSGAGCRAAGPERGQGIENSRENKKIGYDGVSIYGRGTRPSGLMADAPRARLEAGREAGGCSARWLFYMGQEAGCWNATKMQPSHLTYVIIDRTDCPQI